MEADEAASLSLALPQLQSAGAMPTIEWMGIEDISDIEPSSETSSEAEDPTVPSNIAEYSEKETLSYVLGSIIHRVGCKECTSQLTSCEPTVAASNFTTAMKYNKNATLLFPTERVISGFAMKLQSVLGFYEKNFHIKNIVRETAMKFRLKNFFPACSVFHRQLLMTFFCRMVLRIFVKSKNEKLKQKSTRKEKKLRKLNV